MLIETALGFLNHVLDREEWARDRLKAHAGQAVRFELGRLEYLLIISQAGYLKTRPGSRSPDVSISLPEINFSNFATDRAALLAAARIEGSVELAETIAQVFRNLRWDIADDLAPLTGDIVALRLAQFGRLCLQKFQRVPASIGANLAEYLTEEKPLLASKLELAGFSNSVGKTAHEADALARRIAALDD